MLLKDHVTAKTSITLKKNLQCQQLCMPPLGRNGFFLCFWWMLSASLGWQRWLMDASITTAQEQRGLPWEMCNQWDWNNASKLRNKHLDRPLASGFPCRPQVTAACIKGVRKNVAWPFIKENNITSFYKWLLWHLWWKATHTKLPENG